MNNLNSWKLIAPELDDVRIRAYSGSPDKVICPAKENVFRALELVHPNEVRVVILGQDPYHHTQKIQDAQGNLRIIYKASGLCFGYHPNHMGPPNSSLANILAEMARDGYANVSPTLSHLPPQGVLMLNTRLTVEGDKPMSHAGIGWEEQIKLILKFLAEQTDKVIVWLAWGAEARKMIGRLDIQSEMHLVLTASHPCRHSVDRGPKPFRNCGHFRLTNKWLESWGLEPINWDKQQGRMRNEEAHQHS